jgi:hypothetical protein
VFDLGEEAQGQSQVEGLFRGNDPLWRAWGAFACCTGWPDVLQGGSKGRGAHIA